MPVFKKKWIIFCLVATSIFMSTLDSSIVNIALPYIMQDLKTDITTIQWVVLIYLTTVSSLLLTFGRLSDIKGRKAIYIMGFSVFVMGSLFCGLAKTSMVLIVSRALQGSGAAMLMACSPALIVDAFPIKERGKVLGMIGAVVAAGLTVGPVAGGFLLDYFSWRYIFYINIPIGMAASIGAMVILNAPPSRGKRLDPRAENQTENKMVQEPMDKIGSLLLIVILSSLVLFLSKITDYGLFSIFSLGTSVVFTVSLFAFVVVEKKTAFPLFDFNLLKIKLFVFPVIGSAILFASLFMIVFLMPFYLTYPCGFSSSKIGIIMLVPFLFLLFVSPVSGILYDRLGSRQICMIGMGSMALAMFFLSTLTPSMGVGAVLWRTALAGFGTALYISPNNTTIMNSVSPLMRGIASGSVATARNLGMVLGVALAGLIFTSSFLSLSHGATLENYTTQMEPFFMISFQRTMRMGGILALIGLFITYARGKEKIKK